MEDKVRGDVEAAAFDRAWILMIVPEDADLTTVAGSVTLWSRAYDAGPISEIGWMVLPEFQGADGGMAAVHALLERARDKDRWGVPHAFPGVTNAPSHGICRAPGFTLVDEQDVTFANQRFRTPLADRPRSDPPARRIGSWPQPTVRSEFSRELSTGRRASGTSQDASAKSQDDHRKGINIRTGMAVACTSGGLSACTRDGTCSRKSGRVTIAGSRLDVQMGMLWHHLDRKVKLEDSRRTPGAERCKTGPPPCHRALDRRHARGGSRAVVAAEAARVRRNEIVHQDWLLRGRDAMRPVSGLARIATEDLPAYLEEWEWERESRTSQDWQRVPSQSVDVVPAQTLDELREVERKTRSRDRPCIRTDVPRRELPRCRQPARIRPPGPNDLTRPIEGSATGSRVQVMTSELYIGFMDVTISTLRAELSRWIERARAGEEVVVTDRGTPVARLLPVDTAPLLDQLVQRGVLSKPRRADRPAARGAVRVRASGPVADLVSEQRD